MSALAEPLPALAANRPHTGLGPAARRAVAQPTGRFGFGFGRRFFLWWGLGWGWLAPAWWHPRLAWGLPLWTAGLVIAWAVDWLRLPRPRRLTVERSWGDAAPQLAEPAVVTLRVGSTCPIALQVEVRDHIPPGLSGWDGDAASTAVLHLPAMGEAVARFGLFPVRRGQQVLGDAYLRYTGAAGLAQRWARVHLGQTVRVLPSLRRAREDALRLTRAQQISLERRLARRQGQGREFHHLREFREGDETRDICWTASARRGQILTQIRRVERSQTIWLVMDCGRLLRARVGVPELAAKPGAGPLLRRDGLAKLDFAVHASLSLAETALGLGDQVGLLAYGQKTQAFVAPGRGPHHLRRMVDQLADARAETAEANHGAAAARILATQQRRGLVLWLTDLSESWLTPEVVAAAARLTRRHLVLLVAIRQTDLQGLAEAIPATSGALFVTAAARQLAQRRELLLATLRAQGALTLEVNPGGLAAAVVNRYVAIKEAGRI